MADIPLSGRSIPVRRARARVSLPRRLLWLRSDEVERRTRIERLKKLLEERIVFLDGAMGTMIQQHRLDERRLPGRALPQSRARSQGQQRHPDAHPPGYRRRHSPRLSRSGIGHHRDEHVQFELDLAGRLRYRSPRVRTQLPRSSPGPQSRGRVREERGKAGIRGGRARAHDSHDFAFPGCQRSWLPQCHVR